MLCYKDRTWCNTKCGNIECSLNLTDEKLKDAKHWWGNDNPPIAFAEYKDTEICPGYTPKIQEGENKQ